MLLWVVATLVSLWMHGRASTSYEHTKNSANPKTVTFKTATNYLVWKDPLSYIWVVCLLLLALKKMDYVSIESLADYNRIPLTRLITPEMFLKSIHRESLPSYLSK